MGDSEDEYDKKIRDKFRGERTDSFKGRDDRRRDDWVERDTWASRSRGRGDYRNSAQDKYSPGRYDGPSAKRLRTDREDRRFYDSNATNFGYGTWLSLAETQAPTTSTSRQGSGATSHIDGMVTQPPMISLKAFLNTLDDSISDEDSLKKYEEYKFEFRKVQLNEFFIAHKDEEWFKDKYHPVNSKIRKEEHLANLKKRLEIFTNFYEQKKLDNVAVDVDQSDELTYLMDAFVILLEGGTEADLAVLKERSLCLMITSGRCGCLMVTFGRYGRAFLRDVNRIIKCGTSEYALPLDLDDFHKETASSINLYSVPNKSSSTAAATTTSPEQSSNADANVADSDSTPAAAEIQNESDSTTKNNEINDHTVTTTQEDEKDEKIADKSEEEGEISEVVQLEGEPNSSDVIVIKDEDTDDEAKAAARSKRRILHQTTSIFLRNLAPSITKAEIESICKKFKGFIRVAIADPQPDRKWFRRGWITFQRDVDIREIYWNISNIRIRDNELSPIINRDLSRRVRSVGSITNNKHVVREDMKMCIQIITNLDKKYNLWQDSSSEEITYAVRSKNPILKNITSYLIQEISAEEEELLGGSQFGDEVDEDDPKVFQVLDRMLLYLRFVHSVDYYNHCEYPNEDEMPNRCGLIHARLKSPGSKVSMEEVADYCKSFRSKLQHLLDEEPTLSEEEITKLGKKNPDTEVEKFIAANTRELAPEKWLCPLSGKKFKGPEFVLKHITNKYADKVEEVRLEVEYYNSYLADPKRPQLPEHPGSRPPPKSDPPVAAAAVTATATTNVLAQSHPPHYQFGYGTGLYTAGYGRGVNYGGYSRSIRGGYGGRGGRGGFDYRPIINYRDLDALKEPEEFI